MSSFERCSHGASTTGRILCPVVTMILWVILSLHGHYPMPAIGGASSLSSLHLWNSVILNFSAYSDLMIPDRNIMFKL
ncbi:hypothetical protein IW262DRAFT_1405823 [Armillaria fumosa]|nr:hypothetical protein IW262DRAFT_1405823 [Armillaria fumosa]